jgi:hypothetical protein
MAKMLVLSLLRTGFDGDIVVLKNSPDPLFLVARKGVREVLIDVGDSGALDYWDHVQAWKFRVHGLLDVRGYDKVMFLDADHMALGDVTPLLEGNWDLGFYREPGTTIEHPNYHCFFSKSETRGCKDQGANAGMFAVRASRYHAVMKEWERIFEGPAKREKYFTDQAALNRLIKDTSRRTRQFTREEVAYPFSHDPLPQKYFSAKLVHLAGSTELDEKLRFMFGLYLNTYFFDPGALLMQMMEM